MIDKMTKYSFVLLDRERDGFMEKLQSLGLVDITRSSRPIDADSAGIFDRISELKALIHDIESGSDSHLTALKAQAAQLQAAADETSVWGNWDAAKLAATGLSFHFFKTPSKKFDPAWQEQWPLLPVAELNGQSYFVIAGPVDGFPLKELPAPQKDFAAADAELKAKQAEIQAYAKALEGRKSELPALNSEVADLQDRLSRYLANASGESAAENSLVVFEGFAPQDNAAQLEKAFDSMEAFWMADKAQLQDNPPIRLKNRKFVGMYEVLTDMYGRPAYGEFDPTVYISIFFTLFFAFCMGDAGYGLVLTLAGLCLGKMLGKLKPLVVTLGVATMIIGFIFHTFFSIDISQWGWIQSLGLDKIMLPSKIYIAPMGAEYDWTMVLALIVGVFHLCVAFLVKAVWSIKQKGLRKSLGTLGWTLLIVGGVIVGALAILKLMPAAITKWVIIAIGIVSAIGIFFFNNPDANPAVNFGNGLWNTYNTATGLLGDVLSYLRLYALGLAGSMLGAAFNILGTMTLGDNPGIVSWIFCILILVIGHTLNIAMCVLGAFVHPLRLNFLEFFKNSDYQGSGRNYNPLKTTNNK